MNIAVTSTMTMVNGQGPEKTSLELGHTLPLLEEADWLVDERVSPGRALVVCRWRSKGSNQRGSGDNPLLAGSKALER